MSIWQLSLQSARHYWRSHLGLLLGTFLASAVLTGSLLVGESVKGSLRHAAAMRLGKVKAAVLGGDRWFTENLARKSNATPVVFATGSASAVSGKLRANGVQVLGVDDTFFQLTLGGSNLKLASGEAAINEALASRLGLKQNDAFITRMEKPSSISRDAPLSGEANDDVALRRRITSIIPADGGGNFQLQASQISVPTVFLALSDLQLQLEMEGKVNVLLRDSTEGLAHQLETQKSIEDFGITLVKDDKTSTWMLGTDRVFLDNEVVAKLLPILPKASPVLTYLVNGIHTGKGATPYSMVTAADGFGDGAIISQWLADDQKLAVGDELDLRYFTMSTGRELSPQSSKIKVSAVLPMTDPRVNETWTPHFPGISESQNCRDWKPGIPMETAKIRDQDEQYWDEYKATPKVFIPLSFGQKAWANRFGNLTGLRFTTDGLTEAAIKQKILQQLTLTDVGLHVRDLGSESAAAANGSVDFGGLFAGLSMFLIGAALIFAALLFLFTLERRAGQVGLLLAVGWKPSQVRRSMLAEAGVIGVVGTLLGTLGGIAYTKAALSALQGAWGGATAGLALTYSGKTSTIMIASLAALIVVVATLWWTSRRMFRLSAKDLLGGAWTNESVVRSSKSPIWIAAGGTVLAIGLSLAAPHAKLPEASAGMFFGAGFGLLAAALAIASLWMRRASLSTTVATSLNQVGRRNITRRPGRSLAAMAMMASGIFLVVAVNAFRMSADVDPSRRDTGTGGYALIGESSLPVYEDLNGKAGREAFSIDDDELKGVSVLPFRVREGDDASCLNLNASQNPQLVAVNVAKLVSAKAFFFTQGDWEALTKPGDTIPAAVDMNTAMWGLKKGVGDTLDYIDSNGKPFKVTIAALLAGSVLQGKVIIDESAFVKKFPDTAGYRFFLIEAPQEQADEVSELLTSQLEQRGLALEPTKQRLATFQTVQNTYIGIFTLLGGLGVVLGTFGLGILVARHVLERRGELGVMQAMGFTPAALKKMVLGEHLILLVGGLLIGLVSALLAVWPNLRDSTSDLPVSTIAYLLLAILLAGATACLLAVNGALRGSLTDAIRKE